MRFNLKKKDGMSSIPGPTLKRLCKIYSILTELEKLGVERISSRDLGAKIGVPSHSIRKDITYINWKGKTGSGYKLLELKENISNALGLNREQKACIVGIGKLGKALMKFPALYAKNFSIVAGFDSSINKIETYKTDVPLYPAYQIPEVVRRESIELAIIAVKGNAAEDVAEILIQSGIKGIINFSQLHLSSKKKDVHITNIDIITEFRYLSALMEGREDG
jgi:redox-sensing transcriptional repressor